MELDRAAFLWINGFVGQFPWLDALARLLLNDYFVPVSLSLGLLFLWFGGRAGAERERWQRAVVVAAAAVGMAGIVVTLCNLLYYRERPFETIDSVRLLFYRPWDSSFPSNAAAVGFAIATAVWLWDRRAARGFLVLATAFPLARVFGGVHYPLDAVGGAVVGALSALGANWLFRSYVEPVASRVIAAMHRLGIA